MEAIAMWNRERDINFGPYELYMWNYNPADRSCGSYVVLSSPAVNDHSEFPIDKIRENVNRAIHPAYDVILIKE
jgi:hypothetical protein